MAISLTTVDEGRFIDANPAFCRMVGWDRDELAGRPATSLELWEAPADRERLVETLRSTGRVDQLTIGFRTRDGELRKGLCSAVLSEVDGRPCVLGLSLDVTERHLTDVALRLLHETTVRVADASDLDEALTASLATIGASTGWSCGEIWTPVAEGDRALRCRGAWDDGSHDVGRFAEAARTLLLEPGEGLPGRALASREHVRAAELSDEAWFRREEEAAAAGLRTGVGIPVKAEDEIVAVLAFYQGEPRARDPFHLRTVSTAAAQLGRGPEEVTRAAGRLEDAFRESFRVAGTDVHTSASIGIALSSDGLDDPADLLRFSDVAMYRAKGEGGTAHHVFDPATDTRATERLQLENQLRTALAEEQFSLRYQPIVSLADRRIVGAEALLRWEHPERGTVSPAEFLPAAEETGLIVDIGSWVLREAVPTARAWDHPDGDAGGFHLSLNLSARQFRQPSLVEEIRAISEETGFPVEKLVLEVTESTAIHNPEPLGRIRSLGAVLAVDDLGTGYASLEYLTRLDVDALKIDRLFMAGLGEDRRDEAIVRAILLIARELDLSVVAEGIETEWQREILAEMGCRFGQGYHFARPMPAGEFQGLLARGLGA